MLYSARVLIDLAVRPGGSSVSLGSSRMRGSLGSVSSAELGSPSLESMSADGSPMHRSAAGEKTADEAGSSSREELTLDDDAVRSKEKDKEKEKRKSEDDLSTKEKRKEPGYWVFNYNYKSIADRVV